jgi:hypothetical protein
MILLSKSGSTRNGLFFTQLSYIFYQHLMLTYLRSMLQYICQSVRQSICNFQHEFSIQLILWT